MRLLRQGPFARLFAGSALNALGTWATLIALWGYAGVHFHVGAGHIALIGLAWALPAALASPFAGVPIDRFGPKRVLIVSDLIGMATSLALAWAPTFTVLLALALVSGTVRASGKPAAMAVPARLVDDEDLLAANSLISAAEQSAMVFGPLVAAAAITAWSIRAAFLIDSASFLVGVATVASLHLRARPAVDAPVASGSPSVWREVRAGLSLSRRIDPVRRTLLLAVAVFMSWGAFFVLEPLYVRTVLHRSPAVLGLFQTAFGTGLVLTSLLLPHLGGRATAAMVSVRGLAVAVAVSGVAAATYVGTHSLVVAFVGVFVWGVDVAFFMPPMQTLLQRHTPVHAQGRVLALASAADGVGNVVTIPLAGIIVGVVGVSLTGAIVGAAAVIVGAVAWTASRRHDRLVGLHPTVVPMVPPQASPAAPGGPATPARTR